MIDIAKTLIELCSNNGPSGFESKVTDKIKDLLSPFVDEIGTDVLGNVIGLRKSGKENAKKLLLDAHIDEIGLIVTNIEEGFLKFDKLGGLDARTLPATTVIVMTEPPIHGVICVLPPHVLKKEDTEKVIKIEDLFIDIGLTHEEAIEKVPLGTPAVVNGKTQKFGDNLICGKAVDDRAGFVALLRAVELLADTKLDVDLYIMASVQEEVGVRGATTGAFSVDPDYCIVVDVGHAKTPDSKSSDPNEEVGGGTVIHRGPNMNSGITERAVNLAIENDINHQIRVIASGSSGTNTRAIQISRTGVATALFGIPLRYMHTQNEIISTDDIEQTARLIIETAKNLS